VALRMAMPRCLPGHRPGIIRVAPNAEPRDRGIALQGGAVTRFASGLSRRDFMARAGGCTGWLLLSGASPALAARVFAPSLGRVVRQEPWGRLEQVGEGVWALISTPLVRDPLARRTLCNGGIVAGRDGVLVVEGFGSDGGALWMADQAQALTGRRPTHVVVTHYHSDHCNGLHGYGTGLDAPRRLATPVTRQLLMERSRVPEERRVWPEGTITDTRPGVIDLGGRRVTVTPLTGHTPSDLILRVEDPAVVFCGDLLWYGMFPNFVDAIPPDLDASVRAIGADPGVVYVPGHGTLTDAAGMRRYRAMLDHVGEAARGAAREGLSPEEGAARYRLPADVADWVLFSPTYLRVAFQAWGRVPRGAL